MAKTGKPGKQRLLKAHVTHLEIDHPPRKTVLMPMRPRLALMRAENIPSEFYLYLYEKVGKAHHWLQRRIMCRADLFTTINSDDFLIHVLYADGCPAGFFELDVTAKPDAVDILYFGLMEDYQGMGIGKWFLYSAVQAAWAENPKRVRVQTNTLDHPAALPLYQMMGFSPVSVSDVEIPAWD